jgi:N6-adenosine-specific RNA methylase IME4
MAERREHSRKPDEAADALERLFGPVSRIELFARRRRPGWEAWGNELPAATVTVCLYDVSVAAAVRAIERIFPIAKGTRSSSVFEKRASDL